MKAFKQEARYQDEPKGSQRCSKCSMFRSPHGCIAVQGPIQPYGWCMFWEKKGGE